MNQLTMRVFKIFISSTKKENTLTIDIRKSFYLEINSLYIYEEIIVKSSLLSLRIYSIYRLLLIKKFRIFLLIRLRRI